MKVAQAMGEVLQAVIISPEQFDTSTISHYDLIGFWSGIYNGKHHQSLLDLVSKFPKQQGKKTFLFSTSTIPFTWTDKAITDILQSKGFEVIGSFQCKWFMDYWFLKYIFGWLNKWRPNQQDLERAKDFAKSLVF
jgi:flavodoxin